MLDAMYYSPAFPISASHAVPSRPTISLATSPPIDRVLEFSLNAGGGKYAALFDGSEKPRAGICNRPTCRW